LRGLQREEKRIRLEKKDAMISHKQFNRLPIRKKRKGRGKGKGEKKGFLSAWKREKKEIVVCFILPILLSRAFKYAVQKGKRGRRNKQRPSICLKGGRKE